MEISRPGPAKRKARLKNGAPRSTAMEPFTSEGQKGAVATFGRLNFTRRSRTTGGKCQLRRLARVAQAIEVIEKDIQSEKLRSHTSTAPHKVWVQQAASGLPRRDLAAEFAVEETRGADQRQVGQCLRGITEEPGLRVEFFGVQSQRVGIAQQLLELQVRLLHPSGPGQALDVPERAGGE